MSKYICDRTWELDGRVICSKGKTYDIVDAKGGPGETAEDVAGYCDILNCDDGNKTWATYNDVDSYMSPVCAT